MTTSLSFVSENNITSAFARKVPQRPIITIADNTPEFYKQCIAALLDNNVNVKNTARLLGISHQQIRTILKKCKHYIKVEYE